MRFCRIAPWNPKSKVLFLNHLHLHYTRFHIDRKCKIWANSLIRLEMSFSYECDIPQAALNCFKNSCHTSQIAAFTPFDKIGNIFSCLLGDIDINSFHQVLLVGFWGCHALTFFQRPKWSVPVKIFLLCLPLICTVQAFLCRVCVRSHETAGSRDRTHQSH